jgi:hypothetical protein
MMFSSINHSSPSFMAPTPAEQEFTRSILDVISEVEDILCADAEDDLLLVFEPTPIGPNAVAVEADGISFQQSNDMMLQLPTFFHDLPSTMPMEDDCCYVPQQKKRRLDLFAPEDNCTSMANGDFPFSIEHITIDSLQQQQVRTKEVSHFRDYQADQWNDRFQDLLDYKELTGNCLVPHDFPAKQRLAQWVKRQRYQYKLKNSGKHSTLSYSRLMDLEDIGFVWDSHQAAWDEHFESLKTFRMLHGHCSVPIHYEEDKQLSVWIKCQRRQWKLLLKGQKSTLNAPRMERLNTIGFPWNPRGL